MILRFEGMTDRGLVRPNNEDTWACDPEAGLYLVSDGMGGMAAGEVASGIVAEKAPLLLRKYAGPARDEKKIRNALRRVLVEVSEEIKKEGMDNPANYGMGATAVLALAREDKIFFSHVGDSRAYLLRRSKLEQLTVDHSKAQELIEAGSLNPGEVRGHPARFQLTQCMGMTGTPEPGFCSIDLMPGDRIMLATDGVSDMLDDAIIETLLDGAPDPRRACSDIIGAAKEAGGLDNITALVLEAFSG